MLATNAPFPLYLDQDGAPLDSGYLYFGTVNLDPQTSPITVYWDAAGTQPAAQPVRTVNGYTVNAGAPALVYAPGSYSLTVRNAAGSLVAYVRNSADVSNAAATQASLQAFDDLLGSSSSALGGGGQVGFAYGLNYVVGTLGWSQAHTFGIDVTQAPYLADITGATSASAAINAAIAANPGMPIYLPAGTYRLDSEVAYVTASANVFTPGLQIYGDGPGLTIIDNRVANGFAFRVATNTLLKFQHTVKFVGLQITTTTGPVVSGGISLRSAYNVALEDVWIKGLTGDGVKVIVQNGDQDACNMMALRRVRIENCAGWGFNTEVTGSFNEFSFLDLQHTFIQGCGTVSASLPPPSGGMRWKGQVLRIVESAFTINQNIGLYIQGGGGLANGASIESTTFENNLKRHLYSDGIDGLRMRSCQLYSNDFNIATSGIEFDASFTFAIRGVDIDNTVVRATVLNNAYTAFKISGAAANLDTCRVRNTIWQNFDYAGQTRFNGFLFDPIPQQCEWVVLGSALARLRPKTLFGGGAAMPLRLRGGFGGTPSTSGEWIAKTFTAALSITNASPVAMAINTTYYVYLYDNNGVAALDVSTTAPVADGTFGYYVKTGVPTHLFVGGVRTDGTGNMLSTGGSNFLNAAQVLPDNGASAGLYLWADSAQKVRYKATLPTSDTDGTIIGTQV